MHGITGGLCWQQCIMVQGGNELAAGSYASKSSNSYNGLQATVLVCMLMD